METLTGIVLCGGKSTRMGSDKGLLVLDGKHWAEKAFQTLIALSIPVFLSVNATQKEAYIKIFDESLLIEDALEVHGPLAGLFSTHLLHKETDLLLLACDMTNMSTATIGELIKVYLEKKDAYDFFVFKNGTEYEPMPGIYTAKGIREAYRLFSEGNMKKFSMKSLLERGTTFSMPVAEEQLKEFRNFNSRDELT